VTSDRPFARALEAAIAAEVSPCTGCRFEARCSSEQLACDRFVLFAYGAGPLRWQRAPRVPTSAIYAALYDPPQTSTAPPRAVAWPSRERVQHHRRQMRRDAEHPTY
jgi:hypothetical protein